MKQKIKFAYLTAFNGGGGIEKFNRALMRALDSLDIVELEALSLHDNHHDERYLTADKFRTWNANARKFVMGVLGLLNSDDTLILGHINLAVIGRLVRTMKPKVKLVLICHGIEVWKPLSGSKKRILKLADQIWVVSNHTKQEIIKRHGVPEEKIQILHNTIDPYFQYPTTFTKPNYLKERYGITPDTKVLFTLARLSSNEGYKGYDRVTEALARVNADVRYLIGGKADDDERERMEKLIADLGLRDRVTLIGFIPDEELVDHYQLADYFIMPSTDEGFGIVFIEAMACGTIPIAGNADGSVDAVANGALGLVVNPLSVDEITEAISSEPNTLPRGEALRNAVEERFGFDVFTANVGTLISSVCVE